MPTPLPVKIIAGLGAAAAVAAAAVWINVGGDGYPAKGDCVRQTGTHTLTVVACSPAGTGGVYYTVLARFTGVDANRCDEVPGTARAFVEYPSDQSPFVLCTRIR